MRLFDDVDNYSSHVTSLRVPVQRLLESGETGAGIADAVYRAYASGRDVPAEAIARALEHQQVPTKDLKAFGRVHEGKLGWTQSFWSRMGEAHHRETNTDGLWIRRLDDVSWISLEEYPHAKGPNTDVLLRGHAEVDGLGSVQTQGRQWTAERRRQKIERPLASDNAATFAHLERSATLLLGDIIPKRSADTKTVQRLARADQKWVRETLALARAQHIVPLAEEIAEPRSSKKVRWKLTLRDDRGRERDSTSVLDPHVFG